MHLLFENSAEIHAVSPCTIKNAFHSTKSGCYVIETIEGDRYHVYKHQEYTQTDRRKTIFETLGLDWDYTVQPYFDSEGARIYTKFPKAFCGIEEQIDTKENFLSLYRNILTDYHRTLRPILKTADNLQYDLSVKQLFDIAGNKVKDRVLHRLRPLVITSDFNIFVSAQRTAFFEMLKIYATRRNLDNEPNVSRMKEASLCSAHTYTVQGKVPMELRCEYKTRDRCIHLLENSNFGMIDLVRPQKLCQFLLAEMISNHTPERVNELFGFKCHFACISSESDRTLSNTFNYLFRREPALHRLCLPDEFLGEDWYRWFTSTFFGLTSEDLSL